GGGGFLFDVAVSPDGRHVASAGAGTLMMAELILWDGANGRKIVALSGPLGLTGHLGPVVCVTFSHDGKRLASFGVDRAIHIWNVETRKVVRTFRGHGGVFGGCLAF